MRKIQSIDLSDDRLLALASTLIDENNLIEALKILNKNAAVNCDDERSYMLYAEAYDEMGLYEQVINSWFKYLDVIPEAEAADTYEALALGYMNLENKQAAVYYYNLILSTSVDLPPETRCELIDIIFGKTNPPLKFVYPPNIADYTEEISCGLSLMRDRRYDKAVEEFEKVEEGNDKYSAARNYIAFCKVITEKYDEAELECRRVLKERPDDIQALTTLAAVKNEKKEYDESKRLAQRLLELEVKDPDDLYKVATVCCENAMHREAFDIFCKLENEYGYDIMMLYFKAISGYNSGHFDACFDAFDRLLTINPDAVVARYWYMRARDNVNKNKLEKFDYHYRLPQELREKTFEFMSVLYRMPMRTLNKLTKTVDVLECIKWCFDESDSNEDNELHIIAALCAVRAGYDDYVRDLLLNAFLPDNLKVAVLHELCERNEGDRFGVVICNIYKNVELHAVRLGRTKRKYFISAYAAVVSRFAVINESYSSIFASAVQSLYKKMEKSGILSAAEDVNALAAAIFAVSGVKHIEITESDMLNFFDADETTFKKIMEAIK